MSPSPSDRRVEKGMARHVEDAEGARGRSKEGSRLWKRDGVHNHHFPVSVRCDGGRVTS